MTRMAMGVESAIFTYGGELGDYATYKVDGIINSQASGRRRSRLYKELYKFTPPGWGKAFFLEDNQAITEGLAAMSMNFFAFFPALANKATNPQRRRHRLLRQPGRPERRASFAALGGQGISIVSYSKKQDEAMKFLEWFIKDDDPEEVGRARRLHLQRGGARSRTSSARPRPTTRPSTRPMFMVKDFWAMPEYAELLTQMNERLYPFVVGGKGTAKEALDGLAERLGRRRSRSTSATSKLIAMRGRGRRLACPAARPDESQGTERFARRVVMTTLDSRLASRAARGWSDLAIRNLFIIPTILFLIVFNIFPLIYSLGYSFTDFRASLQRAGRLRRPAELSRPAGRRPHLEQLHHHREVRDRLGRRADDRRLRPGAAAQPHHSRSRAGHDAAAAADDDVAGGGRPVLAAALQPVLGPSSTTRSASAISPGCRTPTSRSTPSRITDIWMWSPFVMLLSLAGLSAVPQASLRGGGDRPRRRAGTPSRRITLPLVAPLLLIAIIFRTMEAFKTFDLAFIMSTPADDRADRRSGSTRWRSRSGRPASPARSPTSC